MSVTIGSGLGLGTIALPQFIKPDPIQKQDGDASHDDYAISGWYARNLLFYLGTYYNRNSGNWYVDESQEMLPIVTRGRQMAAYLWGGQVNDAFAHFTRDLDGNNLPVVWQSGKETAEIFMSHQGEYERQLEYHKISALTLSRDVVVQRAAFMEAAKMQADPEFMAMIGNIEGAKFAPLGDVKVENERNAMEMAAKRWKDKAATYAVKMGYDIQESCHLVEKMLAVFGNYYAANFVGTYVSGQNGEVDVRVIPFYNLFWEKCENDPLNRNMKAAGFIEQLNETEILARYKMPPEQEQEITQAFKSISTNAGIYNTGNVNWYNAGTTQRAGTCTVVTCFWIAPKKVDKVKIKDKHGNENYVKSKDGKGELTTNDLYYCVLAGNRWVLECGLANNVVRSAVNKSNPEMPIKVFDGFNIVGNGISMVGLTAQLQNLLDYCKYKMQLIMARDKGIVYLMDGSKLNSLSDNPKRLINDFASMGFSVYNGASGEYGEMDFKDKLVVPLDFRLDASAMTTYANEYLFTLQQMKEIAKLPPIASGSQTQYVSEKVRKESMNAAHTGILNMLNNLTRYEEQILQYAVNLKKIMLMRKKDKNNLVIGKDGAELLNLGGNWLFEDVLVYLRTDDVMDEQERLTVNSLLQAYIQNSQNPAAADATLAALKIVKATTYQEAEDDLEDYLIKQRNMVMEANARADALKQAEMENSRAIVDKQVQGAVAGRVISENTKLTAKQAELEHADTQMANEASQQPTV